MKSSIYRARALFALLIIAFVGNSYANPKIDESSGDEVEVLGMSYNKSEDTRRKVRLSFTAPSSVHRQVLLTEDENATSSIDWGYDSEYFNTGYDDMYWMIENQRFFIQGTDSFDDSATFPLGFHTYTDGMCTINLDSLENISEEFEIYLFDKVLNTQVNLRKDNYEFFANAGEYLERFDLILDLRESLEISDVQLEDFEFYYNNSKSTLTISNPKGIELQDLYLYNVLGQRIYKEKLNTAMVREEIQLRNHVVGVSVLVLKTDVGTISKKILLNGK